MGLMRGSVSVNVDSVWYETEVIAQDDATLKMYLSLVHTNMGEQQTIKDVWDTPTKRKGKPAEKVEGDYWRRIDIGSTAKFKTNIPNNVYAAKIAVAVRYLKMYGKCVDVNTGLVPLQTSTLMQTDSTGRRRFKLVDDVCNQYGVTGEYYTIGGTVSQMTLQTPFVKIDLQPYAPETYPYEYFLPCKSVKVKGGTSKTTVQNVAAPFTVDLLGFDFVETIEQTVTGDLQMLYSNMTEVIAAHPQKDFRWINQRKYEIATPENFESILEKFYLYDGVIAIDTETTGLNITYLSRIGQGDTLTGICLSMKPGEAYYFPLQMHNIQNLCGGDHAYFMERYMRKFLETHQFVTHNNQFDWKVFYIYDINLNVVFDTLIAYAVTEKLKSATFEIGLKALTHNILNMDQLELDDFVKNGDWSASGMSFADLPFDLCQYYAPADADMTLSLYYVVVNSKLLESYGAETIAALEVKFSKLAAYSEFWGYHVNVAGIPEMERTTQEGIDKLYAQMVEIVKHDFNPNSSKQLLTILYDELKYPVMGGGKPTTNKETLKELSEVTDFNDKPMYPLAKLLVEYRKLNGIKSNFLKRRNEYLSVDDTIFPSVKPLGARTGRCSVTEPNYQSYNDVVKKNITPRKGFKMWDCDFSQIEYRTLSSMAKEQSLIDAFADPDMDYHTLQASRMFKVPYAAVTGDIRQQAKRINFALPYGMGDESLGANIFGKRCKENTIKAAELRELYFEGQDSIRNFFDVVRADGVKNGYTTTLFGRKRFYSRGTTSVNVIRRQAGNAVVQGCLHGDTRIQTKELGIVKIKDVVGRKLSVWDGEQWTQGDILYSGKKQRCIVHFNGGMTMECSPIHKFLVRSHKGNDRFVECKDLISSAKSTSPHRVVVNPKYVPSDYKYSSASAYKYRGCAHNTQNVFVEDMKDSFGIGVVLGRLASDGSYIVRENGASHITQYVAEHEANILPQLRKYMSVYNLKECVKVRPERNEKMHRLSVYSSSLTNEISALDIKHCVHDNIFMDTELLRGFLRGFFDGDGGITGKAITLTFGMQYDFEPMCRDLQKALLFFGIRSRYRKYAGVKHVLAIRTYDNARFLELIGFMNETKQKNGETLTVMRDEHVFGKCLIVESVEITDEYIDMYDVCNTERGYYVADGVITHNTAADIYKIACVRMFDMICAKGWLGKVLLVAFVHDEILGEISEEIDFDEFITCWRQAFEVPIEGFCKLYAGFGIGNSWYQAKKQDLHPLFIQELIDTAPTRVWDGDGDTYIDRVVVQGFVKHKIRRVRDYIISVEAQGDIIKPIINAYLLEYTKEFLIKWAATDAETCRKTVSTLIGCGVSDAQMQALTDKALAKKEKVMGLSNLQDWLKVFCFWQQVDYTQIDIKAPEDVKTSVSTGEKERTAVQSVDEVDVMVQELNPQEYLGGMLRAFGIHTDENTQTVYVNAGIFDIQRAQYFIQNYCTATTGFKVILCVLDADGVVQREQPTNYCIAGDMWVNAQQFVNTLMQTRCM